MNALPAPRNPDGRGGPAAAAARRLADTALDRARAVLAGATNPRDRVAAAKLLLRDPAERPQAIEALAGVLTDPRTPDAIVVETSSMILASTGRDIWRTSP